MINHYASRTLLAIWLGVFLSFRLWAAPPPTAEAKAAPQSPLAPIAFLVDGSWVGKLPAGPNGVQPTIEMHFVWTGNHQGIRFDNDFVQGEKHVPYTSGLYGWDPAKKQIVFWYSDSEGSLHQGAVTIEPGILVQDFTITDKAGKVTVARSRLITHGPDSFTNEISLAKDGGWQKLAEVLYERRK